MNMIRKMSAVTLAILLSILLVVAPVGVQTTAQGAPIKIKLRFNDSAKGHQVDAEGSLLLADAERRLSVAAKGKSLSLGYSDVTRVLVEPDSHAGNISFGAFLVGAAAGGLLFGGKIATSIDKPLKTAHVVFIEHKAASAPSPIVVVLDEKESTTGLPRIKAAFSDMVELPVFDESPERLDKKTHGVAGRLQLKGHASEHPQPPMKPGKALLVVASPLGGTFRPVETNKFTPFYAKLIANGQLVGANAPGTYSFFYLDPGEYLLISQAMVEGKIVDVTGLRISVAADKDYYLMHTIYIDGGMKSFLTRHAREVVLQEVAELRWSEWSVKN